jgi:hypothetical protein
MDIKKIISVIENIESSNNRELLNCLEILNSEFEVTKSSIINLTKHMDNVEVFYNKILKEYEKRTNVKLQ